MKPKLLDLNDIVTDVGGVMEDALVRVGLTRKAAKKVVLGLEQPFRELMEEELE